MPDRRAPKKLRERLATNVRSLRQQKKLSQEKLAEKAGLARTYVSEIERLKRNATLDTVELIAEALSVDDPALLLKH